MFRLYETYLGKPLPEEMRATYFRGQVTEYTCDASGMRWYSPAVPGDEAYYETLTQNYGWYYDSNRWDKIEVEDWLKKERPPVVAEIACGHGEMLEKIERLGLRGVGVELSEKAVDICRRKGLRAYTTREIERQPELGKADALLMLQVVEHVVDPVKFVQAQLEQFAPGWVVISVPCYTGLLGLGSDPLAWPPHHVTAWSPRGMRCLAEKVGLEVVELRLQPCTAGDLHFFAQAEPTKRLPGWAGFVERLLRIRGMRRVSPALLKLCGALGFSWAKCSHSVLGVFRVPQPIK